MIDANDFCSRFMPYCLRRLESGDYVILNRLHKPLGFREGDKMRFINHPTVAGLRISPATAKLLSHECSADVERVFLYNDGSAPTTSKAAMIAYLQRLAVLAGLGME